MAGPSLPTTPPSSDAPAAFADNYAASEDTRLTVLALNGLLANDLGAGLEVRSGTVATNLGGSVTLRADGSFDYTPPADANGLDSFDYVAVDTEGREATARVELRLAAVNDAPVAEALSLTTSRGSTLTGRLVADDVDADDDPASLTYEIIIGPSPGQGSLGLLGGGSFTFLPGADFDTLTRNQSAQVVVTWRAVDSHGTASADSTLTLTIQGSGLARPTITGFAEDTGTPGDGITADRSVNLLGRADADAVVDVYRGTTLLGTTAVAGDGSWSFAVPGELADGSHAFHAVARAGRLTSAPSQTLSVTVDGTAPAWGATFADPITTLPGFETRRILLEDMDGDGHLDIIRSGGGEGTILVHLNDGRGNFRQTAALDGAGLEFRIADMDGDGIKDIVSSAGPGVQLRLGLGDGSFAAPLTVSTATNVGALDLGDLDRDGRMDIAFVRYAPEHPPLGGNTAYELRILHNLDGTTYEETESTLLHAFDRISNIRIGQFTSGAAPDIWLTFLDQFVALNEGGGTFWVASNVLVPSVTSYDFPARSFGWSGQVEVGDFDGDGLDDVPALSILTNPEGQSAINILMSSAPRVWIRPDLDARFITLAAIPSDINGDGKLDLIYAGEGRGTNGAVTLLLGDGAGQLTDRRTYQLDVRPGSMDVADLNGDGRPDILLGGGVNAGGYGQAFPDLRLLLNTTTGITGIGPDTGRSATDGVTTEAITLVRGFAEAGSAVRILKDGIEIGAGLAGATTGAFTITLATALGAGTHVLTALATDAAGNVSAPSTAYTALVDQAAEVPVIDGINADTGRSGSDLLTSGRVLDVSGLTEGGAFVELFVDGDRISSSTANPAGRFWLAGLDAFDADGRYSVSVRMTDKAGNVAQSAAMEIVIDREAPVAPQLLRVAPDTGRGDGDAITASPVTTIRGVAEAGSLVQLYDGRLEPVYDASAPGSPRLTRGEPIGSAIADADGAFTISLAMPISAEGVTRLIATATDAAGNVSGLSASLLVDLDRTAPMVGAGLVAQPVQAAGGAVTALAVTDLDGDGLLDIAVGGQGRDLGVLFGAGGGRFEAATRVNSFSLNAAAISPFADGQDLTAILEFPGFRIGGRLVGNADGGLDLAPVSRSGLTFLATLDANGDGLLDAAFAGQDGLWLWTAQAGGGRVETRLSTALTVPHVSALAAGDITGDGVSDLLLGYNGLAFYADDYVERPSHLVLLRGLGDGNFAAPVETLVDLAPTGITLVDLNADGRADAVLLPPVFTELTGTPPLTLSIRLTRPDGTPGAATDIALPAAALKAAIGDVDGDGDADIAVALGVAGLVVLHNDGQGAFSAPEALAVPGLADVRDLVFADVNADGRADLVLGGASGVALLLVAPPGITLGRLLAGAPVIQGEVEPHGIVALLDGVTALGTTTAAADGRFSLALAAPLSVGSHALRITVTDRAGNVSAPSAALLLEIPPALTAPVITATALDADPDDLGGAQQQPVTEVLGMADPGVFVAILVNGREVGGAMSRADGSFLVRLAEPISAEGTYLLRAVVSDLAGRQLPGAGDLELIIDLTAPVAPAITGIHGEAGSGLLAGESLSVVMGTAEPGSLVTLYSGLESPLPPAQGGAAREVIGTAIANAEGRFTVTLSPPLAADGLYRLTATATDPAGNVSAEALPLIVTVDKAELAIGSGYSSPVPAAVGAVADMGFADLDGDGALDLLLAGPRGLELRFGDGEGRFGPGALQQGAGGIGSIGAGDANGDGRLDVLAAAAAGPVVLLEGSGGVPGFPQDLLGLAATRVLAADFAGDGKADLLLTRVLPGGETSVSLAIARPDGSGFLPPVTLFTTTGGIAGLQVADLGTGDRRGTLDFETGIVTRDPVLPDGVADLAILAADGTTTVLWGRRIGAEGWASDGEVVVATPGALALAVGDVDGGAPDLVVARGGAAPAINIHLSDEAGGFLAPVTIALAAAPTALALADMDLDGALDLVVTLGPLNALAILHGDGAGGFSAPQTLATGARPAGLAVADLNNDGRPDIATRGDDGLSLLLSAKNQAPTVTSAATARFAENGSGIAYQAAAMDPEGGALTWSLSGIDAARFTLDHLTGAVTFRTPPDFERPADAGGDNVYDITLTASDGLRSSMARMVAITVVDVLEGVRTRGGPGNDSLAGGGANDSLYGLAGADTLRGLEGHDRLDGGPGADRLEGGAGNDTYIVDNLGDVVVEAAGGGYDRIAASSDHVLGEEVERLSLTGPADLNGTGNALANRLDGNAGANILDGGEGNDVLYGLAGQDTLIGGHGADRLDGGLGADSMQGGADNDTYVVDDALDTVVELAGGGHDRVLASINHTLGDAVERLSLTGTAHLHGAGNALANRLDGNAGANILDGGAGDDALYGLAGQDTLIGGHGADRLDGGLGGDSMQGGADNDTYVVDDALDTVVELAGGGYDRVLASINHALGDAVERLSLTGIAHLDGTGNALANRLDGNAGANTLDGREGNDSIYGYGGDDILIGGAGNDLLDGGADADLLTGGAMNDVFRFVRGQAEGDVVVDFTGHGSAAGDRLEFRGYGSTAQGASLVQMDATTWRVTSADSLTAETITFANAVVLHSSDWSFL